MRPTWWRAAEAGIAVESIARYARGRAPQNGLAIGFGTIGAGQVDDAMRALAALLR